MRKVRVCVDISDEHYRCFRHEAERRGVSVESLVQQMTQELVREFEREEEEGTDHPIVTP